jgi:uncharacterized membrane protein
MTQEQQSLAGEPSRVARGINRLVYWISRHWLAIFNVLVAIYVGLPVLAPVLMNAGATGPARAIYTIYSPLCHQMASRSFFLFGEQIAYLRAIAGTALTPIEAYMPSLAEFADASPDPADWASFILSARRFLGNEQMGYKMALCERDMSIYGAVLLSGLLYGLLRRKKGFSLKWQWLDENSLFVDLEYKQVGIKPLPVWAFLLVGLGPIAFDGFSQLFSQYAAALASPDAAILGLLPLRESTPFLRSLTGALFGLSLVWLTYPHIDKSMKTTEEDQRRKFIYSQSQ